jgi:hypothetical protein
VGFYDLDVVDGINKFMLLHRQLNLVSNLDIFQSTKETVSMPSDADVPLLTWHCCSKDSTCSPVKSDFVASIKDGHLKSQSAN